MDRELAPEEAAKVSTHLVACETCQRVQADFLQLQELIQNYPAPGLFAQRRALASILGSESVRESLPLWKRRIAVPAPVFATLFVVVLALSALIVALRFWSSPNASSQTQSQPPRANATEGSQNHIDFSVFDRGERAVILVVKQPSGRGEKP